MAVAGSEIPTVGNNVVATRPEIQATGYEIPTVWNNGADVGFEVGGLGSIIPAWNNDATTVEPEIPMQTSQVGIANSSRSKYTKKQPKPKQKVKVTSYTLFYLCKSCILNMSTYAGKGEDMFCLKHEGHRQRKGFPWKLYSSKIANKDCESKDGEPKEEQRRTKEWGVYFCIKTCERE